MDPASILSIAGAASSLAFKCGTIVHTLYALTERYKQAELTILSVIQDCRTIELAWSRIERWAADSPDTFDNNDELAERLQLSIYAGQLFMEELEKDLSSLNDTPRYSTLRRRTKILWNESMLRVHQDRIQRQMCALTLLLEIIQLPSGSDRTEMLSIKEPVFRSVEESVRSIVPTRLSTCSDDASSIRSFESSELTYAPFSFENDLFTSYVYKRNFRVCRLDIKQVQHTPVFRHASTRIETSTAHNDDVFMGAESSQDMDMGTNRHSIASKAPSAIELAKATELVQDPIPARKTLEGVHHHPLEGNIIADNDDLGLIQTERVNGHLIAETHMSVTSSHPHISDLYLETNSVEAVNTVIGIKRKPLPSTARFMETPAYFKCIAKPTNEFAMPYENSDTIDFEAPEESPYSGQHFLQQFKQKNLEAVSELDGLLCLPASAIASRDITLALKLLCNENRPLFGNIMQVIGFMRGTKFMVELADALMVSSNCVTEIAYECVIDGRLAQSGWTSLILDDESIVSAAEFRDLATSSGILNNIPTALQLACAAKRAIVVEYLLSLGRPLLPLDWTVHPFILATKRRCEPILELFLRSAKDTVTPVIINSALAMVVNQDCALSENWLDAKQNDNKRLGQDVNLVTFLLANGASPNTRDKNNIPVLTMAIRAAYSLNPFSLQIVDILLRKGAYFGQMEEDAMSAGSSKTFELIQRRHKLTPGSTYSASYLKNATSSIVYNQAIPPTRTMFAG